MPRKAAAKPAASPTTMGTWRDVDSSNLKRVRYDPATKKLHVEFHSGKIAEYDEVGAEKYNRLLAAESKGAFFHKHVRRNKQHSWRYV